MNMNINEEENIVFNNINNQNITQFITENQNIIVEEEVSIKDESLLYKDDIVYLKELEHQLLSEYPIYKQSLKFIQEEVEAVAKKIICVKNIGIKKYNMIEKGIEYSLVNDIINNKFNTNWIYPIVTDKHKIYTKIKEDDVIENNDDETDIYFSESLENKDGIIEENQRTQMITLKELYHNRIINRINYKTMINTELNITKPYITTYSNGYIVKPLEDTVVLRYNDLNNIHWNTYKIINDYSFSKDILDETGKTKGIEETVFLKGEDINIVGFLVLAKTGKNILGDNVYLPQNYSNFLNKVFNKKNNITKIFNSGNSIILECKNHGVLDGETIYIEKSNSMPKINNTFAKSVKVVDENTLELNTNIKLISNGDYGILYTLSKLKFDTYQIEKDNIFFKESNYPDKEINNNHNKVYLFNTINLNKDDYNNIIKLILPNIDTIIKNELTELQKSYTFNDINYILNKYLFSINDLDVKNVDIIKNIFENNLKKIMNEKQNKIITINFNKNSKKYFKKVDYFLSDTFITNKSIEKIYGKYLSFNRPEDNLGLRLKWIESHKDNGKLYYLYYLLNTKNKNGYNIKYIENKKNELQKKYSDLTKNYSSLKKVSKLYKYEAYIITEYDTEDNFKNLKKILLDDTIVFYNNNLYIWKGKLIDFKDIDENTLALVGSELWIWQKNKWTKSDAMSKYNNIKYLCELNNIELSELKLDTLDCIYRKDIGCNTKNQIRLYDNLNLLKKSLDDFIKLESYIKNNEYIKNITSKIETINKSIHKNENYIENKIDNKILDTKNIINDNLYVLINLINKIKNEDLRLNYIYDIIEKDGLIINDTIYSKKYNRKIDICGHYYYFKKINYANNPNEKLQLIDKMINKYSDNGETEKNVHTCKSCGVFLKISEYDDTEGFSSSGMIKKSREVWDLKEDEYIEQVDKYNDLININDKTLKEFLINYNIPHSDIDDAIIIATFIIKNLYAKVGVILSNSSLINTILDSLQKIKYILPYNIFLIKKIKILQEKGLSKMDIERSEQKGIIKLDYERYIKITKSSIIAARYLISIQTSVPELPIKNKLSICSFYSFNDNEGIEYMGCILSEMDIVILKDKTKKLDMLKIGILQEYNDFKNQSNIKELFKNRKIYDIEISKKKDSYKFKVSYDNISSNIIPIELGSDFENILKKSKDIITVRKLQNILFNRLEYLSTNIKRITKKVIEGSLLTNIYTGLPESSCCSEDADKFLNYYFYIMTESDEPIRDNIDESILIYDHLKYFINIGSIHKFILHDENMYNGIINTIIVDDEKNTSQKLIKAVFEIFVDTGINAGLLREYVSTIDDQLDIKSGLTKKQILSKKYTIEEYKHLLKNIEKYNIKYYKEYDLVKFDNNKLNQLKKTSDEKLNKEISNLVKNVANFLNKDETFIKKYTSLLQNFGIFNNNEKLESSKAQIKSVELLNKKKLDYIKKFYITKLKKYLSIIKNGINKSLDEVIISFSNTEIIALDMQSYIYNHNIKLVPFLNEDIQKYFIPLTINYTNDEINSINGIDNIYNSKYEQIKKYSNLNFNDVSNILLYILITQLNDFIICGENNENEEKNENYDSKNVYQNNIKISNCKYICNFIMILFDELENDYELFNLCNKGAEDIKNNLEHDYIEYKYKQYIKDDDNYTEKMMKNKLSKTNNSINYIDNELEIIQDEENDINNQYKLDNIMEKGKKYLFKKHGKLPTDDQLESFKHNYLKNMIDDEMFEKDAYDFENIAKGEDVIDEGGGYGELSSNDFEGEDGFDYTEEQYSD